MNHFSFSSPTEIIFGRGTETQLGQQAKKYGTRALLVYGGGSIKKTGLYDKVVSSLQAAQMEFCELGGVQPNPRLSLVREGIVLCQKNGLDIVLAVGGGSAIDTAKAIAMGVAEGGDVWDFYIGKRVAEKALPVGVLLTIPAAGSEASVGSVITNEDGWLKRPCDNPILRPKFALMNPELTYTLPSYQTACGAADILAHMLERYFTNIPHVDLTDRMLEGAISNILEYAPMALAEPENYDYRAEIMLTGYVAHNNSLDMGRIGDWASHNIEHELSAIYDIAHGAGLAIVFPAWMKYVYQVNIDKFVQLFTRVFGVSMNLNDKELIVREGIARLEAWFRRMGLPTRLSEAGIPADRIDEMAEKAHQVGNFKVLNREDIAQVLTLAL